MSGVLMSVPVPVNNGVRLSGRGAECKEEGSR